MEDFKWGIPITDPEEIARIETRLREIKEPGEPIPEFHIRQIEKLSGRKLGVPYFWPEAFGRKEGL